MEAPYQKRNNKTQWQSAERSIQNEPDTAVDSAHAFKNKAKAPQGGEPLQSNFGIVRTEPSALEISLYQPQMAMSKPIQKASTEKDIRSALVRLNTQGLKEAVKLEELSKLPIIPNTGVRLKKKNLTDLGPGQNCLSLTEAHEEEEYTDAQSSQRKPQPNRDSATRSKYNSTNMNNTVADEDTTTIFDLVHRGR